MAKIICENVTALLLPELDIKYMYFRDFQICGLENSQENPSQSNLLVSFEYGGRGKCEIFPNIFSQQMSENIFNFLEWIVVANNFGKNAFKM